MIYILIFLLSVFVSSLSQILLKTSADKKYDNIIKEYLNFKVIFAYGLFFISTMITVAAYKYVSLSMGAVLEASGYIFVTVLGKIFLKEKITNRKITGLAVILVGILVFNLR